MPTALLADVHANREGLEACMAHARERGATRFAFLGDLVGYGADPGPVVEVAMAEVAKGGIAVLGNHDLAAVHGPSQRLSSDAAAAGLWTHEHLSDAQKNFLASLPLTVAEGDVLFVHANAWAPAAWGYLHSALDATRSFRAAPQRITLCGHVHQPALYHLAGNGTAVRFTPVAGTRVPLGPTRRWLAVVGSAGQPRDGNPGACYALLEDGGRGLTWYRVAYDHEAAARKIERAGLPPSLSRRLREGK